MCSVKQQNVCLQRNGMLHSNSVGPVAAKFATITSSLTNHTGGVR